jgi:putative ABC transport system substrate-binding protein
VPPAKTDGGRRCAERQWNRNRFSLYQCGLLSRYHAAFLSEGAGMRRREFVIGFAGAAAFGSAAARAQQQRNPRRVALLWPMVGSEREPAEAGIRQLHELGWREGQNLHVEWHALTGIDRDGLRSQLAQLAATPPDVFWVLSNPVLAALQQTTRDIPIVFVQVADPVGSGFVQSLAKPGGNITGFTNFENAMAGKWLEILKEIAPSTRHVLVLHHAETAAHRTFVSVIEAVASSSIDVSLTKGAIRDAADIEREINAFASRENIGLIPLPHPLTAGNIPLLTGLAAKHQMPAVYPFRFFATGGGLVSYGSDAFDLWRRSASYIDRILHGARPAELPVQAPTKFQLVINLKTARALGLTVPPTLLARADEVIE